MEENKKIKVKGEYLKLEQLLKIANLVSSGGEAKSFLMDHKIFVNEELDQRRGRKLYPGDKVKIENSTYIIC